MTAPDRPRRTYTKFNTTAGLMFCGATVWLCLLGPVNKELAATAISASFLLAGALLGTYQAVGHLDMRTAKGGAK